MNELGIKKIGKYRPLCAIHDEHNTLLMYHKQKLYMYNESGITYLMDFNMEGIKTHFAKLRITERMARAYVRNAIAIGESRVVICANGGIYRVVPCQP